MARQTQVVEVTVEYLVTRYDDECYYAHPTTVAGMIDPVEQAIEVAIDMDYWEDDDD